MWQDLRTHPFAPAVAVGLHVIVALVFFFSLELSRRPLPPASEPVNVVEATAVSGEAFDEARAARQAQIERQRQAAQAEQRRQEEARRQAELELQRQQEAARQAQLERERQQVLELKRQEEARQKALELQRQEEARRQAAEKARLKAEEEKRLRAEAEAEQALLAERLAAEETRLEAERKAEQARLAAIEAERQRQEDARRQAALQRELSRLRDDYRNAIKAAIERQWRLPPGEPAGQTAVIWVEQTPGGYIQNVRIKRCQGSEAFCRSVEAAVWKADPLPAPPKPEVFERELEIQFEPVG